MNNFNLFTKKFVISIRICIFVWITISTMEDIKDKKKQERGVVHLLIKATGENFYYGNLKALFDNHEETENDGSLGAAYNYIKNYDFLMVEPTKMLSALSARASSIPPLKRSG